MSDSIYHYGKLHHVTLEVTYRKTYQVKAVLPSHAEDIAVIRASRNRKDMSNRGFEFVKAKPVKTKKDQR